MSDTTNLFLISTPLQLINAIEAKKEFNMSDSTSVAIFMAYSTNFQALLKLIDRNQWREVYFVDEDIESIIQHEENFKRKRIISILRKAITDHAKLKRFLKSLDKINNVVIGYYLSLENIDIVNRVAYNRVILLDDGIATIESNRRRIGGVSFLADQSIEDRLKTFFKKYFLRYRIFHPSSVWFFTIYKIEVSPRDRIVQNNFLHVKSQIRSSHASSDVYLLGQPLSEIQPEVISEDSYFNYLERACEYFEAEKLVYIPHRDEAPEKLLRLKSKMDIDIKVIDIPIEFFLLQQPELPKKLVGFITSALPNCKEIFGDSLEMVAIRIDSKKIISKSMVHAVENTYEYFEKIADRTFKIISLEK